METRDLIKIIFFLKYLIQNNVPDYKKLKERTPIIGIWDDHDYGDNNGTVNYPGKYLNQQLFLDFMDVSKNSIRRGQEGIYTSYTFGKGDTQVKFILLDNRFYLTDKNDPNSSVLGQKQWAWFENELKTSQAKIHFIVSGIPFLPNKMIHTEEWADYPKEKEKLLSLLKKYNTSGVMFLSGDKHFSAITQNHGHIEIMSSGLTHKAPKALIPWLKTKFPTSFYKLNYGLIDIKWGEYPTITVQIKSQKGTAIKKTYYLKENKITPKD